MVCVGVICVGVIFWFACLVHHGGSLSLLNSVSFGVIVGLSSSFCLHVFTNSPLMYSAAAFFCSTGFVSFVLWA
jgi:hypothetical protein